MINKRIIDGENVELTDKSQVPYKHTFAEASTHTVRYGIDATDEICAYAFQNCTELSYISFPDEIKKIKRGAFKGCTSLEKVPLSKNIEYIGKEVFDGCTNLKEVDFEHDNPPTTYCTFPTQTTLYVPNGQKYEEVAYERMNLDGTVMYFTQNAYSHKYERMYDVTFAEPTGQYFRNKWDALADNDHVVEQKNRYPVTNIDMPRNVNISLSGEYELSYVLSPEEVTNTQLYWYSKNNILNINTDTGKAGIVKITVNTASPSAVVNSADDVIAYDESGISATTKFTLTA